MHFICNDKIHILTHFYDVSRITSLFYILGTMSIQCAGHNDSIWHYTNNIYVTLPTKTVPISTESLFACQELCTNESEFCFAVVFNTNTNACLRFVESSTMDYHLYVLDSSSEIGYIQVCTAGNLKKHNRGVFTKPANMHVNTHLNLNSNALEFVT